MIRSSNDSKVSLHGAWIALGAGRKESLAIPGEFLGIDRKECERRIGQEAAADCADATEQLDEFEFEPLRRVQCVLIPIVWGSFRFDMVRVRLTVMRIGLGILTAKTGISNELV